MDNSSKTKEQMVLPSKVPERMEGRRVRWKFQRRAHVPPFVDVGQPCLPWPTPLLPAPLLPTTLPACALLATPCTVQGNRCF